VAIFAVIDLAAKVGYGLYATAGHARIAAADLAAGADARTSLGEVADAAPRRAARPVVAVGG